MSKTINSILEKYYNEANKGLNNNKVPSSLNRGEGTEKEYYILKIMQQLKQNGKLLL